MLMRVGRKKIARHKKVTKFVILAEHKVHFFLKHGQYTPEEVINVYLDI